MAKFVGKKWREDKEVGVSSYWMMERDREKWREDTEVDVSSY